MLSLLHQQRGLFLTISSAAQLKSNTPYPKSGADAPE
jgi:hypothetical protein